MNTTRMLYMPIPMQLAGMPFLGKDGQPILDPGSKYGKGFVPPGYGSRDFGNTFNLGGDTKKPIPFGLSPINNNESAFQTLLNQATSNPARYTPGYNPMTNKGGHHPIANQLLGVFDKSGPNIGFADDTGSVQLTPGGLNVQSNKGWSAGFNPMGGNVNVGPVGVQGTWAGDKSIQATFSLGSPKEQRMGNTMMNMMKPVDIHGPGGNVTYEVQSPLNEAQRLRDQMLYEYEQKDPYYYRP
jgi:hypothetical protein